MSDKKRPSPRRVLDDRILGANLAPIVFEYAAGTGELSRLSRVGYDLSWTGYQLSDEAFARIEDLADRYWWAECESVGSPTERIGLSCLTHDLTPVVGSFGCFAVHADDIVHGLRIVVMDRQNLVPLRTDGYRRLGFASIEEFLDAYHEASQDERPLPDEALPVWDVRRLGQPGLRAEPKDGGAT